MKSTRLVTPGDAAELAELLRANREFLAPWEPVRDERYYTAAGQRAAIDTALARHSRGESLPCVVLGERGEIAGRVNLNDIVLGAFRNGNLGYWLDQGSTGHGLATAAVREVIGAAFAELLLHRIQAGTLPHNYRSQRVLERNGFVRFGVAPQYLKIAGKWQDHVLYQLVNPRSD